MDCPKHFRFARIQGDAKEGKLVLVDHDRPRLELAWGRIRRREYDGQRFALKRLRKILGSKSKQLEAQLSQITNRQYEPLLFYKDPQDTLDRAVGFHPNARRVLEIAYHRGDAAEDRMVHNHLLPNLRDQSILQPQHWSFFDVSFTAPAGFRYESARLNLGDMRVRLVAGSRSWNGPRIVVGQVYPASLALKRQDVTQWVRNFSAEIRSHYRPASGKVLRVKFHDSPQGRVAQGDLVLRRRFRPFLPWTPRQLRMYVIHHEALDRLTFLNITDDNFDRIDEHFRFVSESMHWAGLET